MASNTTIREPWGGGPNERLTGMANGMLQQPRKSGRPSRRDKERLASSSSHDNISLFDPLEDQWDDLGYPKDTSTPAARQSNASVDLKQRHIHHTAETSSPWRVGLKSTISEDLSRHDDNQAFKLQYLQKRLDRPTSKSLHGGGPNDNDSINYPTVNRKNHCISRSKHHIFGRLKEAK